MSPDFLSPDPEKRKAALNSPTPEPPLPTEPTEAQPGTIDKVEAMARRVASGEGLWHPDDRKVSQAGNRNISELPK